MAEKLTRPHEVLAGLFGRLIARGEQLRDSVGADNVAEKVAAFESWDSEARRLLQGAFTGPESWQEYPPYFNRNYYLSGRNQDVNVGRIREGISARLLALTAISELLPLYEVAPRVPSESSDREPDAGPSIFIVHGRSDARYNVREFLQKTTNASGIFLSEEFADSSAIIEKLEEFARKAAFAIVVMTGDDYGGLNSERDDKPARRRARQNVIFELGLFMGSLGRTRVTILYEEGVEKPSDIEGILYTTLDPAGAWRMELGRKLRTVGFTVDLNTIR